uniref:Putative secreted peptide n=1 Tax=Anopheles braziliensis TaxID=58242 RepID=A0A2M3ZRG3_9DIPT
MLVFIMARHSSARVSALFRPLSSIVLIDDTAALPVPCVTEFGSLPSVELSALLVASDSSSSHLLLRDDDDFHCDDSARCSANHGAAVVGTTFNARRSAALFGGERWGTQQC